MPDAWAQPCIWCGCQKANFHIGLQVVPQTHASSCAKSLRPTIRLAWAPQDSFRLRRPAASPHRASAPATGGRSEHYRSPSGDLAPPMPSSGGGAPIPSPSAGGASMLPSGGGASSVGGSHCSCCCSIPGSSAGSNCSSISPQPTSRASGTAASRPRVFFMCRIVDLLLGRDQSRSAAAAQRTLIALPVSSHACQMVFSVSRCALKRFQPALEPT